MALWRRLGLHDLLSELMDCGRETVPWAEVAAVLTAGKFCGQASELRVAPWDPAQRGAADLGRVGSQAAALDAGSVRKDDKAHARGDCGGREDVPKDGMLSPSCRYVSVEDIRRCAHGHANAVGEIFSWQGGTDRKAPPEFCNNIARVSRLRGNEADGRRDSRLTFAPAKI